MKRKVLLIYTGGTIGMKKDYDKDSLSPVDFEHIVSEVPELNKINASLDVKAFRQPIDSSDMNPGVWSELVEMIENNYNNYDGFVILHGSDTMAYTASALSFMLENLDKPVILTGSQLPIGTLRTDGKENLITAIEIATDYRNDRPMVPEVAIYFEYRLYRGNRARKVDAEHFNAFETLNYPYLAEAGVSISYNEDAISKGNSGKKLTVRKNLVTDVAILKLFPGITESAINAITTIPNLKAILLESYGSGNAPNSPALLSALENAIKRDIVVLNVSQCHGGSVSQKKYKNGKMLDQIGVIGGGDITSEAGITKLMYLLTHCSKSEEVKMYLKKSLRGEMSEVAQIKV